MGGMMAAATGGASMELVAKVKEIQRDGGAGKDQWGAYCDTNGAGVRDPAKHDNSLLESFIGEYMAGTLPQPQDSGSGPCSLSEFVKEGQRKSSAFKNAWAQYNTTMGGGKNDPSAHGEKYIVSFLDYLGQRAAMPMPNMGGNQGAMVQALSAMMAGKGGGGLTMPLQKRPRLSPTVGVTSGFIGGCGGMGGFTGDAQKDELVMRVKGFQRSGDDAKQNWWAYCDNEKAGVRDPARHDAASLGYFCNTMGI